MQDIAAVLARKPARIGLTLGDELDEILSDRGRVICWVPAGAKVKRLLLVGGSRTLRVFIDQAGWSPIDPEIVTRAGCHPASLNRSLTGLAMEAWLAGDPGVLYPCDLLAYEGWDVSEYPLSERLSLLRQALTEIQAPGRWFRSHVVTGGSPGVATRNSSGLLPLARHMRRPYETRARVDWVLPLALGSSQPGP